MRARLLPVLALSWSVVCADLATGQIARRNKVSQFGITWTFDKSYTTGQFANGDWWVVGPVKIVNIDPPSRSGKRIKNGSMINPVGGIGQPNKVPLQGYDNKTKHIGYDAKLNVALDVSSARPLAVKANSSLVSTISVAEEWKRPQLQTAAILTVLSKAAKTGDFRPPYCGKDKSIKFNVKQLKYSLLQKLKPVGKPPSLAEVERKFERPWLEHAPHWMGSFIHPAENMQMYGRNLSTDVGTASLMLNLDFSLARKKTLLIRFVQLGIDKQGIADDGGHRNWVEAGGHNQGRKWPILFAGLLLDDPHMKNIGKQDVWFQEDRQCFYITQADIKRTGHPQADLGKPMWSEEHTWRPHRDTVWGKNNYQFCCTANSMNGTLLSALVMGAKKLWNHDATFDYQDRYLRKGKTLAPWLQSYDTWSLQMWKHYRGTSQGPLELSHSMRDASSFANPTGTPKTKSPPREIRLSWNPASHKETRSYRIYCGSSATALKLHRVDIMDPFYTDPEVQRGKTLYYAVSAVDKDGKELQRSKSIRVRT